MTEHPIRGQSALPSRPGLALGRAARFVTASQPLTIGEPGRPLEAAWTPGTAQLTPEAVPAWKYVWPLVRFFQRRGSPAKAAQSPLWLAASSEAERLTGTYLETRKQQRPKVAADPDNRRRVIELAHALVSQAPTAPRSYNP